MRQYWVYILASTSKTLYVGITSDLLRRVLEHKNKFHLKSFTARYNLNRLVYFEEADSPLAMISREKQLKKYNRQWKIELIEKENPDWEDLSVGWF